MATIIPFKGILYNNDKVGDVQKVVAPPYDVISEEKQGVLHDRHENNVIRLILGNTFEEDNDTNNRHTRSADFFNNWMSEDILKQDQKPALYLTTVEFSVDGKAVTRYGLVSQVALEPFEKGIILPHEQTFSKVKSERLGLLKICKANFSQIFSIFSDQVGVLDALRGAIAGKSPDIDIIDDVDERHRLWRITDSSVIEFVQAKMQDKCLYIADGHHRYETALNYRNWLKETDPSFSDNHPANNIMMYLCCMEDPGLIIFPTHRMLNSAAPEALESLLENADEYFDIDEFAFGEDYEEAYKKFHEELSVDSSSIKIGAVIKERASFYIFSLKPGVMDAKFGDTIPESLRKLDVTVLTYLVFIELLGLTQAALDEEKLITYTESGKHAADAVVNGQCDVSFILNSTKVEQVQDIAESGQTMPRKTTYFYPKALTGLVFNDLQERDSQ